MMYRKKPVVVTAEKVTPEFLQSFKNHPAIFKDKGGQQRFIYAYHDHLVVDTSEGSMRALIGDYLITGVNGEKYPCKPEIFESTHEAVE